jgi:hypothetical protein
MDPAVRRRRGAPPIRLYHRGRLELPRARRGPILPLPNAHSQGIRSSFVPKASTFASVHPAYPAARILAPILESHFGRQLAAAGDAQRNRRVEPPDARVIEKIIEVAFWASLRREEGRNPKISLAFLDPGTATEPLLFEKRLPLDARALTRIAPAVERAGIHLGVWPHGDDLAVWGTLRSIPAYCFVLEVIDAGLLVVKHRRAGDFGKFANVAVLEGDEIRVVDERGARVPDCPSLLCALLDFEPRGEDGPFNPLVQIAASMRSHGRGGSLLVVPAGAEHWRRSVVHPLSYAVDPPFSGLAALIERQENVRDALWQDAVRRSVEALAGLTAVDGATVINERYQLLAFGAKIARPEGSAPVERVVVTEPVIGDHPWETHPAQLGGTRHLSAAQFIHDQRNGMALVASQDGRFTIFAWSPRTQGVHAHRVEALLL